MIEIYDTTLRDGTQSEGFTLSGIDKLRIAKCLDAIGVAIRSLSIPDKGKPSDWVPSRRGVS